MSPALDHTKGQLTIDNGSTLFDEGGRCIGVAYGYNEMPAYDADGKLLNKLTPTPEAIANARLWAEAATLLDLFTEYLDPVLPAGMSAAEWKIDFDTRVRVSLLRIAGPQALKREAA